MLTYIISGQTLSPYKLIKIAYLKRGGSMYVQVQNNSQVTISIPPFRIPPPISGWQSPRVCMVLNGTFRLPNCCVMQRTNNPPQNFMVIKKL